MRLMGGNFSEYDISVVKNVMKKIEENYDFDNKLDELSPQEKYVYIGICSGVNAVVTMAENSLKERSADVLNEIFGQDLFVWDIPKSNNDDDSEVEDFINKVIENPEIINEIVTDTVTKNVEEN